MYFVDFGNQIDKVEQHSKFRVERDEICVIFNVIENLKAF